MKIFKGITSFLIVLTILGITSLGISRGKWNTYIELKDKTEKNTSLNKDIKIEIENSTYNNSEISNSTEFIISKNCIKIDSLSIKMMSIYNSKKIELINSKTLVLDSENIEFDTIGNIKKESYLSNTVSELCQNQRIEISNWFQFNDENLKDFSLHYYVKEVGKKPITKEIELEKVSRFNIVGKNHYDYIVVIYPILWLILIVLIIIKLIQLFWGRKNI